MGEGKSLYSILNKIIILTKEEKARHYNGEKKIITISTKECHLNKCNQYKINS
jgi:hypothetical protein